MTGALDTKAAALAKRLIDRFGKNMTWRSWTRDPNAFDHQTSTQPGTSVDHAFVGTPPQAFDPASLRTGQQFAPGDTTSKGEMYVMMASTGLTFTPKIGDEVIIDSRKWLCSGVQEMYGGELIFAYNCRVLRGS